MARTGKRDPGARRPRARGPGAPSSKYPTITLCQDRELDTLEGERVTCGLPAGHRGPHRAFNEYGQARNLWPNPGAPPLPGPAGKRKPAAESSGVMAAAVFAAAVITREIREAAREAAGGTPRAEWHADPELVRELVTEARELARGLRKGGRHG